MANPNSGYEIPAEMRDFAERSIEQARKAIDGFMGAAQRTVDSFGGSSNPIQSGATDLTRKNLTYAEQNLQAAFDLAQKLVRAKDLQEAMQHQAEFVRQQFASMQSQMQEFGSLAQSAMTQGMSQAGQAGGQAPTGQAPATGAAPAGDPGAASRGPAGRK